MSTLSWENVAPPATGPSSHAALGEFLLGPENAVVGRSLGLLADGTETPSFRIDVVPLTISAPTGLGKSLLLRAIAAKWSEQQGSESVMLTTAADFARNYATAVKLSEVPRYQQRYQRYGCLLIDDLDTVTSKQGAQQQLATIIEHRERHHRPTVITARQPLRSLNLSKRLTSRLAGGLTLALKLPTPGTRKQILGRLCDALSIRLEPDATQLLSEIESLTVPQLSGLLNQLKQQSWQDRVAGRTTDESVAVSVQQVRRLFPASSDRCVEAREVIRATSRYFGLPQKNLTGSSRRRMDVLARSVAMYLIRELTGCSYLQVGKHFGGRDHTTVMHAHRKIEQRQATDATTRNVVLEIRHRLDNPTTTPASSHAKCVNPSKARTKRSPEQPRG